MDVYNPLHIGYSIRNPVDRAEVCANLSPMARKCLNLNPHTNHIEQTKVGKTQASNRKMER